MQGFKTFKEKFTSELTPFLDMLKQRSDLNSTEWLARVRTIELRVVTESEQYLGKETPSRELTAVIVREIFENFVREQMPAAEQEIVQNALT